MAVPSCVASSWPGKPSSGALGGRRSVGGGARDGSVGVVGREELERGLGGAWREDGGGGGAAGGGARGGRGGAGGAAVVLRRALPAVGRLPRLVRRLRTGHVR